MKNKQKGLITPLVIAVIILFIIGGGIYIYVNKKSTEISQVACTMEAKLCSDGSYVGRTEPNCEFASCPSDEGKAEFGKSVIMHINEEAVFPDGLILILKEVNDSRCPANVQCIWQGELSALFSVNIQNSPEEIHLGTVNNKEIIFKNYTFFLKNATENTATVVVSKN